MFNRRLSKGGSGGVATHYVYDGGNEVQAQNSKGAVSANMLNGLGLDDRFTRTAIASGTTSAFLVDGLGSTLGLAYTGAVKTDYAYQPYGTASVSGTSNTNTYEYTGRELDGSGLQYNRNRYYNPAWGRFVSEDPIGFAGGPNVYAYVGGDPVNGIDPTGLGRLDPNSQECMALAAKIANLQQELEDRYAALSDNQYDLPERIGPGEGLRSTIRGHRTLINKTDNHLRAAQRLYDDKCGPPPPPAICPVPAPQTSINGAKKVSEFAAILAALGLALRFAPVVVVP